MPDLRYNVLVVITYYERPEMCKRLIEQLNHDNIIVFDDGSSERLDGKGFKYIRAPFNHGKQRYWRWMNLIFDKIKRLKFDYLIFLPDDIQVNDNFIENAVKAYKSIDDDKKISLNLINCGRKANWTNFKRQDFGNYYKTQWVDMCFISTKKILSALHARITPQPKERWKYDKQLSSGVGKDISVRLHEMNYNMYQVKKSLCYHGDHESKMNPDIRSWQKLISK